MKKPPLQDPTPRALTPRALNRATLARQLLLERARIKVPAALDAVAGMQAQLARPPFVGLWSRIDGFRREDLVEAIDRREVVRATLMRGTIHLVSRGDYLAFRPVIQPMLTAGMRGILKERMRGIDVEGLVAAAREVFRKAPCTFGELRTALSARYPGVDERAMGYIVRMQLPLVQVPEAGTAWAYPGTADFTLAESWLGAPVPKTGSLAQMALRYVAAFGPATVKDLQTWSYLDGMAAVVETLRPKLVTFKDERGRELFDLPKAPRPGEDVPAPVRFLPEFDNLLLAYADRTRIVSEPHRKAMATRNLFQPATLLVDGRVAGTWTLARLRSHARLVIVPFVPVAKEDRAAIEAEGLALVRFAEPDAASHTVEISKKRGDE